MFVISYLKNEYEDKRVMKNLSILLAALCASLIFGSFVCAQEEFSSWVEIANKASLNIENFEYTPENGLIGYWIKFEPNNSLTPVDKKASSEDYYFVSNCKNNTISYLDKVSYDVNGNVIEAKKSGSDFLNVSANPSKYIFEPIAEGTKEDYIQKNACLVYNYVIEKGNTYNKADLSRLLGVVPTQITKTTTVKKTIISEVYEPSSTPQWHKISQNKYFDLESLRQNSDGTVSVWVKEFNDGTFDLIDSKKVLYNLSLVKYDCSAKKTKVLKSIDYDLSQKVLRDFDYSNFATWKVSASKNSDLEYAFLNNYKKN